MFRFDLPASLAAFLTACVLIGAFPASAQVRATGTISGDVELVRLSVGSAVEGYDDVVVFLDGAPKTTPTAEEPLKLTQRDKAFVPKVLVVRAGARVEFPNEDKFFHNVFSLAPAATFDLGLYKGGDSRSVVFKTPGIIPIYCNIHPQMVAYVIVVDNPFYTRAKGGHFKLDNVPKGTFDLVAWFPYGGATTQKIHVEAGKITTAKLVLREESGAGRHKNKHGKTYSRY